MHRRLQKDFQLIMHSTFPAHPYSLFTACLSLTKFSLSEACDLSWNANYWVSCIFWLFSIFCTARLKFHPIIFPFPGTGSDWTTRIGSNESMPLSRSPPWWKGHYLDCNFYLQRHNTGCHSRWRATMAFTPCIIITFRVSKSRISSFISTFAPTWSKLYTDNVAPF